MQQACYTGTMLEIGTLLLLAVILTGAGLAAWRVFRGPASNPQALALRISAIVVVATALVTFSAWKLSKARTIQLFGGIVPRVETDHRVVALTFDDGPSEQFTEQVLQVLSEQDVKATFFVTGKALAKNPESGQQRRHPLSVTGRKKAGRFALLPVAVRAQEHLLGRCPRKILGYPGRPTAHR